MTFNRRYLAYGGAGVLGVALMGRLSDVAAGSGDEAAVKQSVESFRKAMLGNDRSRLDALTADQLSYGHSGGRVENKAQFLDAAVKSRWKFIDLSDESNQIVGNNAISRFTLTGETESDGKINAVKIGVLMVWLKQADDWKLLARQAVKV
jgi:ketosteroid isomerase-like protein